MFSRWKSLDKMLGIVDVACLGESYGGHCPRLSTQTFCDNPIIKPINTTGNLWVAPEEQPPTPLRTDWMSIQCVDKYMECCLRARLWH
jgi:hypothetical protein